MLSALILAGSLPVIAPTAHFAEVTLRAPRAELRMQVAATYADRELGLMHYHYLPARTGMIFVFKKDDRVDFWMKNTLIPLDMVFVGGNGRVRSVAQSVPASTIETPEDKIARRSGRAKFVLELPAQEAERDGLVPGAYVAGIASLHAKDP